MLRLRTLGRLALDRDGAPVGGAGGRRRALALLAVLAGAGERGVSRERLLLRLWPDSQEEKARNVLAQTLHVLRRDLGAEDLVLGTVDLRLNPAVITSDLAEFQLAVAAGELERAAELYQGPFLDGFYLSEAAEFERWAEEERAHLAVRAAGVLEALARRAAAAGDAAGAAVLWRRLASVDPLNSRVTVGLMQALAASGDPGGALQAARVHEALLREELGTAPDSSVTGLVTELQRRPSSVEPPAARTVAPDAAPAGAPPIDRTEHLTGERSPSAPPPSRRRSRSRTMVAALGTLVALGAIGAAGLALRRPRTPAGPPRVLVAAFENNTGDRGLDVVGRMAADWITQRLAETQLIEVVDTRTVMLTRSALPADTGAAYGVRGVRALASETGASAVVWGSYYRDGDSLRFQAQLLDPARGTVIRTLEPVSGAASAPLAGIEHLRERVTGALAVEYNPRLSAWIGRATRPPTYAAYQEFMTGVDLSVAGEAARAAEHFARAYALDTTYAQALLWAIDNDYALGEFSHADSLLHIVLAARQHLAPFDQRMVDYYVAVIGGDNAGALEAARRMAAITPGAESYMAVAEEALHTHHLDQALDAIGHVDPDRGWLKGWAAFWQWRAYLHHLTGDAAGERVAVTEGLRRHPASIDVLSSAAVLEGSQGRYAAAERYVDRAVALPADGELTAIKVTWVVAEEMRAHRHPADAARLLARALDWYGGLADSVRGRDGARYGHARMLYDAGRLAEARVAADSLALEHPDSVEWVGLAGSIAARQGRRQDAARGMARLATIRGPYRYGAAAFARARIAALLGERDVAVGLVREALAEGKPYNDTVHREADLESLRDYEPYRRLWGETAGEITR